MAQKARKDLAKSNAATLQTLHIGTLVINFVFLLFSFTLLRSRSLKPYFILSLPAWFSQFILERSSRPTYNPANGTLQNAGQDLSAEGLTEYMLDIIWTTWGCLVLVLLVGNWGWLLYTVVPAYGAWKAFGLFGAARGMMGGANGANGLGEQPAGPQTRRQRRAA